MAKVRKNQKGGGSQFEGDGEGKKDLENGDEVDLDDEEDVELEDVDDDEGDSEYESFNDERLLGINIECDIDNVLAGNVECQV